MSVAPGALGRALPRTIALIRGVGGATALKMPALREVLASAGLGEVGARQVAGNVVLDDAGRSPVEIAGLVREAVGRAFGFDLPVVVRMHTELADAHARNPFASTAEGRRGQTVLLATAPSSPLAVPDGTPEEAALDGREVFVRYPEGIGGSKFQAAWFEKRLGVVGTARNANTVAKLIAMSA
ncbi:DUF1697 domain-containing protein [Microbacterium sp. NPDC090007]|uniref:DUF1697 domain-containing protein n=1 Tax=Microbacterium sp. NPDC090007 TaxID=3364204 RepID=UPI00381750BD